LAEHGAILPERVIAAVTWSARMSYSLTVASSEPVQKAVPWGKNWKKETACFSLKTELWIH